MNTATGDWAAAVFVLGPDNKTPLVWDESYFPKPIFWKFPGGKKKAFEIAPYETAARELKEETGLVISDPHKDLELLYVEDRGDHTFFLFAAKLDSFDGMLKFGDEGEIVSLFPAGKILDMRNFSWSHKRALSEWERLREKA